jgi:hypothetical protein
MRAISMIRASNNASASVAVTDCKILYLLHAAVDCPSLILSLAHVGLLSD